MRLICEMVFALLALTCHAGAAEFHVEAGQGNLQALIDAGRITGGDRIILADGYHGRVEIDGTRFDTPVTLTGAGGAPELESLLLRNAAGWVIERVTVLPREPADPGVPLIEVSGEAIHLDRLTVASALDTSGWDAGQWLAAARHGVSLSGKDITLSNSLIRNVRHGVLALADGARIVGNTIELFSGDGMRGLGNNSVYQGNTVRTCVKVDDNHDDGFQSYTLDLFGRPGGGVVRNVRIEGNRIENGTHPLTCHLQGIGLFDGIYEDWVIRDNLVIVDNWHGITVMGARNVEISGNIVVDALPGEPGAPWIAITAHKDGRPVQGGVITANVTQPWAGGPNSPFAQPQPGVRLDGNRTVQTLDEALQMSR